MKTKMKYCRKQSKKTEMKKNKKNQVKIENEACTINHSDMIKSKVYMNVFSVDHQFKNVELGKIKWYLNKNNDNESNDRSDGDIVKYFDSIEKNEISIIGKEKRPSLYESMMKNIKREIKRCEIKKRKDELSNISKVDSKENRLKKREEIKKTLKVLNSKLESSNISLLFVHKQVNTVFPLIDEKSVIDAIKSILQVNVMSEKERNEKFDFEKIKSLPVVLSVLVNIEAQCTQENFINSNKIENELNDAEQQILNVSNDSSKFETKVVQFVNSNSGAGNDSCNLNQNVSSEDEKKVVNTHSTQTIACGTCETNPKRFTKGTKRRRRNKKVETIENENINTNINTNSKIQRANKRKKPLKDLERKMKKTLEIEKKEMTKLGMIEEMKRKVEQNKENDELAHVERVCLKKKNIENDELLYQESKDVEVHSNETINQKKGKFHKRERNFKGTKERLEKKRIKLLKKKSKIEEKLMNVEMKLEQFENI